MLFYYFLKIHLLHSLYSEITTYYNDFKLQIYAHYDKDIIITKSENNGALNQLFQTNNSRTRLKMAQLLFGNIFLANFVFRLWVIYHLNIFPSQNHQHALGKKYCVEYQREKCYVIYGKKIWMLKFEEEEVNQWYWISMKVRNILLVPVKSNIRVSTHD